MSSSSVIYFLKECYTKWTVSPLYFLSIGVKCEIIEGFIDEINFQYILELNEIDSFLNEGFSTLRPQLVENALGPLSFQTYRGS